MNTPLLLPRVITLASLLSPLAAAEPLTFTSIPPKDPQEAAKTFHVLDGFAMQLIGAEPLVTDPVALAYDEDGRAFVCEMNDYPYTNKASHKPNQENPTDKPIGRVRLLEDTDGDGVFDKGSVFADGLSWPTGVACWKGGVFVTATPDIWYLKDTDGDGKADVREKAFTGFNKLNVQAVMNNPAWGLDHRIYVAGGTNGASITRPDASDFKPIAIKRNDFSFDPESRSVEIESGGARFGNAFDDWGNRFLCNIRNPAQHVVLPYRWLTKAPFITIANPVNDAAEAGDQLPVFRTSPVEPWRDFRAKRWSAEGSTLPRSELVSAGVVTSSSGISIYRGDAYPKEFRDYAFVADVAGNLFYRLKLIPDGATFKAVQVDQGRNFCTSDDLWHRPVNFVNAPDGCLHVCDMYREVIEHPWSIPDDIHAAIDLLRGTDKGRLYRLAPNASFKPRPTPKLSKATTAELVALLDHPNAWHRETAHRLLFDRQDQSALEPLRAMLKQAKTPQGRLHAMWSLHGLSVAHDIPGPFGSLHPDDVAQVLQNNGDWRLAAQALHIAIDMITAGAGREVLTPALTEFAKRLTVNSPVALPLAFALGEVGGGEATSRALLSVYRTAPEDAWLRPAIAQAGIKNGALNFIEVLGDTSLPNMRRHRDTMILDVAKTVTAKAPQKEAQALTTFAQALTSRTMANPTERPFAPSGAEALLHGVAAGARQRGWSTKQLGATPDAQQWWEAKVRTAAEVLRSPDGSSDKLTAIPLVALGSFDAAHPVLTPLLAPTVLQEVQTAALDALTGFKDARVAPVIIGSWKSLTPALRDKALASFLAYPERIQALLDAVESKVIPTGQLSMATRLLLTKNRDHALADRAAKLFDTGASNRAQVVNDYAKKVFGSLEDLTAQGGQARAPKGDPARGARVYETVCMVCHKHGDRGNDVGPNLGTVKLWPPQQILTNILDPNREVSPNFALYIVETRNGRTLSGILASETAAGVTIRRADGGTDQVQRSEIQSMASSGISLMPEGLEAVINPQQMADLIEFLRS